MPSRLLLASALLAVTGIAHHATAQSLTAPPTASPDNKHAFSLTIPPISQAPSLFPSQRAAITTNQIRLAPPAKPANIQLAANLAPRDSTCYSIRSYNFPPGDLQSDAPKPSSSSTCTSASASLHKKVATPPTR